MATFIARSSLCRDEPRAAVIIIVFPAIATWLPNLLG